MHIAKGLSIREDECYACIAHLDPKASEQEEREKVQLLTCALDAGNKRAGDPYAELRNYLVNARGGGPADLA